MSDEGYIDYFAVLGLTAECKPGEVRKQYKVLMKALVLKIAREEITEARRNAFLLEMCRLNAAYLILRDTEERERYTAQRDEVIALEAQWQELNAKQVDTEEIRRDYDGALKQFLSTYMEERMLEAGRDKECIEASKWDPMHERHASTVLRKYRQQLYHKIQERLPYAEITTPSIDWNERAQVVSTILEGGVV